MITFIMVIIFFRKMDFRKSIDFDHLNFRRSIDFDLFLESQSLAASTEEILWSDDDTIIAEQEITWNKGK